MDRVAELSLTNSREVKSIRLIDHPKGMKIVVPQHYIASLLNGLKVNGI